MIMGNPGNIYRVLAAASSHLVSDPLQEGVLYLLGIEMQEIKSHFIEVTTSGGTGLVLAVRFY